jgi:hypothetical protein
MDTCALWNLYAVCTYTLMECKQLFSISAQQKNRIRKMRNPFLSFEVFRQECIQEVPINIPRYVLSSTQFLVHKHKVEQQHCGYT